jgi:MGT family glycosyltransferase
MQNFLFATWEGGGCVPPALTVARKLARRGHRVRVISDLCNRPEAEAAGAAFIPWKRAPSRPDRSRETDNIRDWDVATPREGIEQLIDRLLAGRALDYALDIKEELEREPADLVVSSDMLLGVPIGAEAAGHRHVLLTAHVSLFPMAGVPPLGPGLAPPKNEAERALQAEIAKGGEALWERALPAVNEARIALGLEPLERVLDQPLKAERLLLGTSRAFDFAPECPPPHIRYVGPQLDDPAWAEPWVSPWPADDQRPLVLVGFSTTFQNHAGVLQRVVDAMRGLPVRALVTLGETIEPRQIRAGRNVKLVRSAPHNEVMREAQVVVTHGGHGTVTRALVHRRPMLIIPHGRDQNDNAVRVTERRAGLSLPPEADVQAIRGAVSRLLLEPGFRAAAWTLGGKVAHEAENSPVVAELEALAAAGCLEQRAA